MIAVTLRWMKYPINARNRCVICSCAVISRCTRNFTDYLLTVLLYRISRLCNVRHSDFYICVESKILK